MKDKLTEIQYKLSLITDKMQEVINGDNKKLAAIAEDIFLKTTVFINSFLDNLGNLSDKEFNILADKILKKLNGIKADNTEQTIKLFSALSPMYNGDAIEALGQARTIGEFDMLSKTLKINGVDILQPDSVNNIGVGAAKIFRYALAEFTKLHHQNTPSEKLEGNLRLFLDLNDYAQATGADITTDTARRNFRRKIRDDLEKLKRVSINWTERVKGKPTTYAGLNYIGYYEVKGDTIMIEFTLKMAEYLVSLPQIKYPRALYSLKDSDFNAFAIGEVLARNYSIDNNVLRGNHRKIKIDTLLKYTSFPTMEKLRANRWSWNNYVQEPFMNCLDRLYQIGFIKDWCFAHGDIPLTDEEAANINTYGEFVSLILLYDLNDFEDAAIRKKAIEEKRAEKMKKLAQSRKKRKNSDNN